MATDWSITHSPTPRYLSTHFDTSLFSPATLSVLKLGLDGSPNAGATVSSGVRGRCAVPRGRVGVGGFTHVKPVERFIPARNAETRRTAVNFPTVLRARRLNEGSAYRAQHQRHNGSAVRALTITPKSASRGAGSDLRLRSDGGARGRPSTNERREGQDAPPS
jgi:hypothetical protein